MRDPFDSVLAVPILIGAVQGLFLAIVLAVMRKGNRRANSFLAALLFVNSLGLLDGFLDMTNYYARYPGLIGALWPGYYLVGPFLYFYVKELTSPKPAVPSRQALLHFLPAAACVLLSIPFYSLSGNEKIQAWMVMKNSQEGMNLSPLTVGLVSAVLQKIMYLFVSVRMLAAHSSRIKQSFSSIEKLSLAWLRTLLTVFISVCVLCLFYTFLSASLGISREAHYSFYLALAVIMFLLAAKALLHPELFSRLETAHQAEAVRTAEDMVQTRADVITEVVDAPDGTEATEKYQKSRLRDERALEIEKQLVKAMETEKPHLKPDLTLTELSNLLSVTPHHLSQVINRELNKSFFDFVNEYRVQEAKRLLLSPESSYLSILGIALDAGFNSKSAFYAAFNKHVGMTPSEFRKQPGSMIDSTSQNPTEQVP